MATEELPYPGAVAMALSFHVPASDGIGIGAVYTRLPVVGTDPSVVYYIVAPTVGVESTTSVSDV